MGTSSPSASTSRDLLTVDLRGMKAALLEGARVRGVLPSDFVRASLADALGLPEATPVRRTPRSPSIAQGQKARLSLRMTLDQATEILAHAKAAGLSPGAYVAGLVAEIPMVTGGAAPAEHLAALVSSTAEMSTLARHLGRLGDVLRAGSSQAGCEHHQLLSSAAEHARRHIALASAVLADMRPRRSNPGLHQHL